MPNCQGASQQQTATRTPGTSRRRHCIWNAMRNRPASHAKSSTVRDPYSKGDGQTAKKTIRMRAYRHILGRDRSTRKRAYVHRARTGTDPATPLGAWQNRSDFRHPARLHGLYLKNISRLLQAQPPIEVTGCACRNAEELDGRINTMHCVGETLHM